MNDLPVPFGASSITFSLGSTKISKRVRNSIFCVADSKPVESYYIAESNVSTHSEIVKALRALRKYSISTDLYGLNGL